MCYGKSSTTSRGESGASKCQSISDSSCSFKPVAAPARKWLLRGTDRLGRGIDVLTLGDNEPELKESVLDMEEQPQGVVDPKSLNLSDTV